MLVAIDRDPNGLPGSSIARVVRALLGQGTNWTVCIGSLEGANVPSDLQQDGSTMPVDAFLRKVEKVKQLDWGDFYLFSNVEAANRFRYASREYRRLIPKAHYLVRAIDDTYIYVFSTQDVAADLAATGILWESVKQEDLRTFVFPD